MVIVGDHNVKTILRTLYYHTEKQPEDLQLLKEANILQVCQESCMAQFPLGACECKLGSVYEKRRHIFVLLEEFGGKLNSIRISSLYFK